MHILMLAVLDVSLNLSLIQELAAVFSTTKEVERLQFAHLLPAVNHNKDVKVITSVFHLVTILLLTSAVTL